MDDQAEEHAFRSAIPVPAAAMPYSTLPVDPAIAAAYSHPGVQHSSPYHSGPFATGLGVLASSPPSHPPPPQVVRGNLSVEQIEAAIQPPLNSTAGSHTLQNSLQERVPVPAIAPISRRAESSPSPNVSQTLRRPSRRQLETLSMTDREVDGVLKMHERLIESNDPYREDYYRSISFDRYPYTSATQSATTREVPSSKPRPEHTARNMKVLATALGSVQSWTPRAPRKVVSFRKDDANSSRHLVREDERVLIRKTIERGYDILADLEDFRRGRSTDVGAAEEDFQSDIYQLLELDINSDLSVRIAALSKGKHLVSKCLTVLSFQQQFAILLTMMGKLSLLCDKTLYSGIEYAESAAFWATIVDIILEPTLPFSGIESALLEFVTGHALNEVVTVLASSYGCNILYQLLCRAYNEGAADSGSADWDAAFTSLVEAVLGSLEDIFGQSEDDVMVWRLIAILDEVGKAHRKQLRQLLTTLLSEGRAPPPPPEE